MEENKWQPIETAPKDERVLVVMGGYVVIARFDKQEFKKKPKPLWRSDAVMQISYDRLNQPTKWMPLPKP